MRLQCTMLSLSRSAKTADRLEVVREDRDPGAGVGDVPLGLHACVLQIAAAHAAGGVREPVHADLQQDLLESDQ